MLELSVVRRQFGQFAGWSLLLVVLALGASAAGGCGGGSESKGIPCSGPEHCSSYGLVCHSTLLVCVQCNTSADCNGGACVNASCQSGAGGNVSAGGQGGSGLTGSGGVSGSISSGGVSGSIGSGGVSGSIGSGGVSGSISSGGVSGSISSGGVSGSISSGGSGGSEPICDSTTPNGLSDCCPDALYPWWCWHGYTGYGNCFAYGVDCSTVTVCSPETFARACQPGNSVICTTCISGNYGYCYPSEGC